MNYISVTPLPKHSLSENEQGFASLVVGLVLVVVVALLTVGFGQLSLHEQRQALNSALATQAYYAAETGIDDAVRDLTTVNPNTNLTYLNNSNISGVTPGSQCMKPGALPAGSYTANNVIDGPNDVSYTCMLIGLVSPNLTYSNVAPGNSRTVIVQATNLNKLVVAWGDPTASSFATLPNLPTATNWSNKPGVLEFSVTPIINNTFDRAALSNKLFTFYAYPSAAGSSVNASSPVDQGRIAGGGCAAGTPQCSVTINGVPNAKAYLIHFLDLYDPSSITITGFNGSNPVQFTGGQATIDVTGRAKYVLKRLQVRVPLNSSFFPDFAIQAQDICKRLQTLPGTTNFMDTNGDSTQAGPGDDPFCVLSP